MPKLVTSPPTKCFCQSQAPSIYAGTSDVITHQDAFSERQSIPLSRRSVKSAVPAPSYFSLLESWVGYQRACVGYRQRRSVVSYHPLSENKSVPSTPLTRGKPNYLINKGNPIKPSFQLLGQPIDNTLQVVNHEEKYNIE